LGFKIWVKRRENRFLAGLASKVGLVILMAFLGFLAGAALGGLAGYAMGSWSAPGYYWHYWYPHYYPYYYPYYSGPMYPQYYYPTYTRPYSWHPWFSYW
jgi:hypothetical protein